LRSIRSEMTRCHAGSFHWAGPHGDSPTAHRSACN